MGKGVNLESSQSQAQAQGREVEKANGPSAATVSENASGSGLTDIFGLEGLIKEIQDTMNGDDGENDGDDEFDGSLSFWEWLFFFIVMPIIAIISSGLFTLIFIVQVLIFVSNFPKCWPYYCLYLISTLIYFPFSMLFLVLDLTKVERVIFKFRDRLHNFLVCNGLKYTGLHNTEEIQKTCFGVDFVNVCRAKNSGEDKEMSIWDYIQNFFKEITSLNYITVVTLISFITFFSLLFYYIFKEYIYKAFLEKMVNKSSAKKTV